MPLEESVPAPTSEEQSQRRWAALQKLAGFGAFSGIQDSVAWPRATRADRDLPGREP